MPDPPGRVLALDLGTVRVGVAISDATRVLASPLTTLARADGLVGPVARLVSDEEAALVIVGLPLNMDGSEGLAAASARRDAAELEGALDVPVELVDERLTTVAADRVLVGQGRRGPARRKVVDQTAAALLLQGWLDRRGGPAGGHAVASSR